MPTTNTTIGGFAGDPRRWPIFSKLPGGFAESTRLFYIFAPYRMPCTCAFLVTHADDVWALGTNVYGLLGTGNDDLDCGGAHLSSLSGKGVKSFANGEKHALALTGEGIYGWGQNDQIQVGKYGANKILTPTLVYNDEDPAVEIACGDLHSACRTLKGRVYCWGDNYYGQIGIGNNADCQKPRKVNAQIADLICTGISCCRFSTVAVFENGEVYAWGSNDHGELGNGSEGDHLVPVRIDLENFSIRKISSGFRHTLALAFDGTLFVWGRNDEGQLGLGHKDTQSSAIRHPAWKHSCEKIVEIAAYGSTSVVKTCNSKVFMWGAGRGINLTVPSEVSLKSVVDVFAKFAPYAVTPAAVERIYRKPIEISIWNCARFYSAALRRGDRELERVCLSFAVDNLTAVTQTKGFMALPRDILSRFISEVSKRGAFKN